MMALKSEQSRSSLPRSSEGSPRPPSKPLVPVPPQPHKHALSPTPRAAVPAPPTPDARVPAAMSALSYDDAFHAAVALTFFVHALATSYGPAGAARRPPGGAAEGPRASGTFRRFLIAHPLRLIGGRLLTL